MVRILEQSPLSSREYRPISFETILPVNRALRGQLDVLVLLILLLGTRTADATQTRFETNFAYTRYSLARSFYLPCLIPINSKPTWYKTFVIAFLIASIYSLSIYNVYIQIYTLSIVQIRDSFRVITNERWMSKNTVLTDDTRPSRLRLTWSLSGNWMIRSTIPVLLFNEAETP